MAASSAKDICFNRFDEEQYDPGEPFGSVTFYTHGPELKWHAIALEQSIAAVTAFHAPRAASMNFASLSAEGAVTIYTETGAQTEQIAGNYGDSLLNAPNTETQGEAETGLASCRGRPNHESYACLGGQRASAPSGSELTGRCRAGTRRLGL